ncbi:MAG: hypothetical protein ACYC28_12480 [Longimicrobiales bacterium]
MRLGLSSAAATDADIDALLASCARRGLAVLELRDEDAHGVSDVESARAAAVLASDFGVAIAAIRVAASADVDQVAAMAAQLEAAVLVAAGPLEDRVSDTRRLVARGVQALVEVSGPADGWLGALEGADTDVAWQIDQAVTDLAGDVQRVLRAMPGRLRYVRLLGGGPETAMEDGRGIGALMGQLALARFDGPLVVAPSSPRYHVAWGAWLGRRGGWGCGSKADREVVQLSPATTEG